MMDGTELDNHLRTIIHIDIDCFYAQVEMNKNPKLRILPMGVQQKNIVVTSNYVARELGIKKLMLVSEAKKLCPDLSLVNGEDLHDYRQVSFKITTLLQKFSNLIERLGLDENYVDVTDLVQKKLKLPSVECQPIGHVFGDCSEICPCGCHERLILGTQIAQEIRDLIKNELNLTTCAGIGHNKLLAKIVGAQNKPNQQTVVFPNTATELMLSLNDVNKIPGIGRVIADQLEAINIKTVRDLQECEFKQLVQILGEEKAKNIYRLGFGIDPSLVKTTGRPQSIGIEDSCKTISVQTEVREKLSQLLERLLILVNEDGRIPKTIKLTVRKYDKDSKISHRETRQCNINASLFLSHSQKNLKESNIMTTLMHLFNRMVDNKTPYHITLLGLSFTKFQDPPSMKNSIATFLRRNLEVQSITSIENQHSEMIRSKPSTSKVLSSCPSPKLDTSPLPSPKKIKLAELVSKKRCFNEFDDCASPSKLRVADLRLSSIESPEIDYFCPPNADKEVFNELPKEIQKEIWEDYRRNRETELSLCGSQIKKAKPNTLFNYFIKN